MKRIGILCGVGGLLLVLGVLWLRPADAQDPSPVTPTLPSGTYASGPMTSAPPVPPPSTIPPEQKKTDNIYELLTKLASIKAKKAELDKAENETMALLKKELSQLKQQSKKLGVTIEEDTASKPAPETAPPPLFRN